MQRDKAEAIFVHNTVFITSMDKGAAAKFTRINFEDNFHHEQ